MTPEVRMRPRASWMLGWGYRHLDLSQAFFKRNLDSRIFMFRWGFLRCVLDGRSRRTDSCHTDIAPIDAIFHGGSQSSRSFARWATNSTVSRAANNLRGYRCSECACAPFNLRRVHWLYFEIRRFFPHLANWSLPCRAPLIFDISPITLPIGLYRRNPVIVSMDLPLLRV